MVEIAFFFWFELLLILMFVFNVSKMLIKLTVVTDRKIIFIKNWGLDIQLMFRQQLI